MMLITTSRRPSRRTRSFIRDLFRVIPGSKRVNRGKSNISDLCLKALREGLNRVLIVETKYGNPSAFIFILVNPDKTYKHLSEVTIRSVTLRREMTSKRVPNIEGLCLAFLEQAPPQNEIIEALRIGFGVDTVHRISDIEDLKGEVEEDVAFVISSSRSTFYYVPTGMELGPRMKFKKGRIWVKEEQ